MSRDPTPKMDRLREMREAQVARAELEKRAAAKEAREKIAAIPATKPKREKKGRKRGD